MQGVLWILFLGLCTLQSQVKSSEMSDEMKELAQMLHNSCIEETGADEASISKAQKGDFEMDNTKLQCYMKCVFVQGGAMEDDGAFDPETVIATLPPDLGAAVKPALDACGKTDDPDPCKKALLINKCFFEHSPKSFFLI